MNGIQQNRTDGSRGGFSLVEVALAILVAAGGLVSAFSLFPVSLRQSADARTDLIEASFAATVLETIAGNVRQIDDVAVWNDPAQWWKTAVGSCFTTSLNTYATPKEFQDGFDAGSQDVKGFSLPTLQVAEMYSGSKNDCHEIRYYGIELTDSQHKARGTAAPGKIQEPAQWLLRLSIVKRPFCLGKILLCIVHFLALFPELCRLIGVGGKNVPDLRGCPVVFNCGLVLFFEQISVLSGLVFFHRRKQVVYILSCNLFAEMRFLLDVSQSTVCIAICKRCVSNRLFRINAPVSGGSDRPLQRIHRIRTVS